MFLTLSVYYYINFFYKNKNKHLYLFIFCLSCSFTLKAWCLPFFILLIFTFRNIKENTFEFKKINFYIFICFIFLFFILLNQFLYSFNFYIVNDIEFLSEIKKLENNFQIINLVFYFIKYFLIILFFINIFFIFLIKLIFYSNKSTNFIKCITFFFLLWFILVYPFISDFNIFFKSILDSFQYTSFNKNIDSYQFYLFKNILADLRNFHLNSFLLITLFFSPLFLFFKFRKQILKNQLIISLYFLSIISYLFINLFVKDYGNQFHAKYLYSIYILLFVIYLIKELSIYSKKFYLVLFIIFLNSFVNIFFNWNYFKDYKNYFDLDKYFNNIVISHGKIFSNTDKIYICGGTYPLDDYSYKIKIIKLPYEKCFEDKFLKNIESNNLIYFTNFEDVPFKISKLFYKYYEDEQKFIGRYGVLKKNNFTFLKLTK